MLALVLNARSVGNVETTVKFTTRAIQCLAFFVASYLSSVAAAELPTWDAAEIERIVDAAMADGLDASGVPGASIALVHNGKVLLAKGYGTADLDAGTPATADTPFRIASLSKLFTATAILRLDQRGALDLHDDIDRYLDFPLLRDFPEAITIHRLLTHTAGFETTDIGDAARSVEDVMPLATLIQSCMVRQSHAPGEIYAYSNHGYALLGLLIEKATGQSFDSAMDSLVLQPLGMSRSSFTQPLPDSIRQDISRSYADSHFALQRDYSQIGPADALVSTANDMAKFILMQLHGHPSIEPGVVEKMQAQQYAPYPTRYGMAYAWHENTFRGHRVLEHSGGQLGFASYVAIIPDAGFGFFIAQNLREGSLRSVPLDAILDLVLDRVIPDLPPAVEPPRDIDAIRDQYTGYYVSADYPRHSFERLLFELAFMGRDVMVNAPPPCTLEEPCRPDALAINSSKDRYYETRTEEFQHPTAWWATAAFDRNPQSGAVTGLYLDRRAYEKRPPWRLPALQRLVMLLMLPIVVFGAIVWPWLARRNDRGPRGEIISMRVMQVCAAIGLLALIALGLLLRIYAADDIQMDYGIRFEALLLMLASDCLKVAAVVAAVVVPIALARRYWRPVYRIFAVILGGQLLYSAWLLHISNVSLVAYLGSVPACAA